MRERERIFFSNPGSSMIFFVRKHHAIKNKAADSGRSTGGGGGGFDKLHRHYYTCCFDVFSFAVVMSSEWTFFSLHLSTTCMYADTHTTPDDDDDDKFMQCSSYIDSFVGNMCEQKKE